MPHSITHQLHTNLIKLISSGDEVKHQPIKELHLNAARSRMTCCWDENIATLTTVISYITKERQTGSKITSSSAHTRTHTDTQTQTQTHHDSSSASQSQTNERSVLLTSSFCTLSHTLLLPPHTRPSTLTQKHTLSTVVYKGDTEIFSSTVHSVIVPHFNTHFIHG